MVWREIAEAPLDGSRVDLWIQDRNGYCRRVPDAWWDGEHWLHDEADMTQPVLPPEMQDEGDRITHFLVLVGPAE